MAGLVVMALLAGCGQDVKPGRTHHRLYAWNCPSTETGRAFLVLRYQDEWVDATKTTRVGLIKFQITPEPSLIDDRYVWGVPAGEQQYVLFDAMRNQVVRRTAYTRRVAIDGEAGPARLLAFAAPDGGTIELVRPDGQVVVPAAAGYEEAKVAFRTQEGAAVVALSRNGRWELRDELGQSVGAMPMLTALDFSLAIGP